MKPNRLLVTTSVISMLLLTLHLTDDIVRGISPAAPENMYAISVAALLLYATLVHPERKLGIISMLFTGLFAFVMPLLHLRGKRIGEIAAGPGGFFFIWTLWALGVIGLFQMILAIRELVLRRRPAQ